MAKVQFVSSTFSGSAGNTVAGFIFQSHPSYPSGSIVYSDAGRARGDYANASLFYAPSTPPSADYFVEAYVHKFSKSDKAVGVCARVDTASDTYYMLLAVAVGAATPDVTALFKVVNGVSTQLGSTYVANYPFTTDTRIAIEVSGTSIKGYIGSTEVITATDSDITAAGKSGLYTLGQSANGAGIHLDNWMAYRETTQYETPALLITTSHAAPTYETFAAVQTYETPHLLIETYFSDKIPSYTSDPSNVYETPELLIGLSGGSPDYIVGDAEDGDGQHPLFWLSNQDWSSDNPVYETPNLTIEVTPIAPDWTRSDLSMSTPSLLISLTKVAGEWQNVEVGNNIQYETPSLLIDMTMPAPTYSVVEPPVVIPGIITGTAGYAPNTITGTIGTSLRITGISGRSS